MELKIGDYVKISKTSEYYGRNKFNPTDEIGRIISISERYIPYQVQWKIGANCYRKKDLILMEFCKTPLYKLLTGKLYEA